MSNAHLIKPKTLTATLRKYTPNTIDELHRKNYCPTGGHVWPRYVFIVIVPSDRSFLMRLLILDPSNLASRHNRRCLPSTVTAGNAWPAFKFRASTSVNTNTQSSRDATQKDANTGTQSSRDSTQNKSLDGYDAKCKNDDECFPKIRGSAPASWAGAELCECYSASETHPFDECEGDEQCFMARCVNYECYDFEVYCDIDGADDGDQVGECKFRDKSSPATSKDSTTDNEKDSVDDVDDSNDGPAKFVVPRAMTASSHADTPYTPMLCSSHDQCVPKIRGMAPSHPTSFGLCECYSASKPYPFDECEGDNLFVAATCSPDACDDLKAYCDFGPNKDLIAPEGMGECQLSDGNDNDTSNDNVPESGAGVMCILEGASYTAGTETCPNGEDVDAYTCECAESDDDGLEFRCLYLYNCKGDGLRGSAVATKEWF